MKVTGIAFAGIPVTDIKRARAFYDGLLGFAWGPFESPCCHMAIVQDPDGNKVIIHKVKVTS